MDADPTAMGNQPALWSAGRARWLIPAGALTGVAVTMLVLTLGLQILLPWTGIIVSVALYLAMIGVAIWVRDPHRRNIAFAWLMGGIAAVAALALALIAWGESLGGG